MNEKLSPSLTPVELEFRITSEDTAILAEEAVAKQLLKFDRRKINIIKFFDGLIRVILAGAPFFGMALIYFFDGALKDLFGLVWNGGKVEALSFCLVALIYWILWWRYRKMLCDYLENNFMRRDGERMRSSLVRGLHRSISSALERLEGLYHVRMDRNGFHLKGPLGKRSVHVS